MGEWIDIKEKLPDKNKSVLCYCKNKSTGGETLTIGSYSNEVWFLQGGIGEQHYPRHYWRVICWQPLPEPPSTPKGKRWNI